VLIAKRPKERHQGGLWEFPGGKVEPGEDGCAALRRELREELGIEITIARPLIQVRHRYADRAVLLDCWRVSRWEGEVYGREGQRIAWARPEALDERRFLPADKAILTAARLPALYLISPDPGPDLDAFLATLDVRLRAGLRLFQLRCREIPLPRSRVLVREVFTLCERYGARLLLNSALGQVLAPEAHGLHLTSMDLLALKRRPLTHDWLIAASCHNAREIAKAARLALDFIVLGPVLPTPTHPDASTLGWTGFADLVRRTPLPVYALGGLRPAHLPLAWRSGAQGIAAIRGLWSGGGEEG
jgi:8-oxo-dGTP diphosphatase